MIAKALVGYLLSTIAAVYSSHAAQGSVSLAWNPSPDPVAGYILYCRMPDNTITRTGIGSQTAATVGNLVEGYTYTFYATAYDTQQVESGPSNEITYTVPVTDSVPAAPNSLAGRATYATTIEINWADSAGNEKGFKVFRATGTSNPFVQIAVAPANASAFTNVNLNSGSLYSYKVVAFNDSGDSPPSNTIAVATPVLPTPPTNLSGFASSGTQIRLSWSDASTNETAFRILRKTGTSGSYVTLGFVSANTTTYINQNLNPGVQYFYKVAAQNEAGVSVASNEISVTTKGNKSPSMVHSEAQPKSDVRALIQAVALRPTALIGAAAWQARMDFYVTTRRHDIAEPDRPLCSG